MANKTDQKTLELIKEVRRRKDEIAKLERPIWRTNCSFVYDEDSKNINIHVIANIGTLVDVASFILSKSNGYSEAADFLGVSAPAFMWRGFTAEDWLEDIKTRINQIQITSKRKSLESLESRLDTIISPELRAELELEAIESELS